jgi:integrase
VIDLGRDADGKRRQKWSTVHGGKRDAQRELTRLLNELNTGAYVEPSRLTLGEFLEKWLVDYARSNVTAKTFERYAQIIRKSIRPALGSIPLAKLQPLQVQGFYTAAQQGGRLDGREGGLSPTTVLQYHRILRQALQHAVKWGLVGRNVADQTEPPAKADLEPVVLDASGAWALLEAARGHRLYPVLLLAIGTGARRGELCGLRWDDVTLRQDSRMGAVVIQRTLEVTKDGLIFKVPKTKKSRRTVTLPGFVVEGLIQHKGEQAQERLALGPLWQDHGLVCPREDGSPWNPDILSQMFAKWMSRQANIPRVRFHDLRHTHATLLLSEGENPKVVSERLGHSGVGITLDVYSHVLPNMQDGAARKVDQAFQAIQRPALSDWKEARAG